MENVESLIQSITKLANNMEAEDKQRLIKVADLLKKKDFKSAGKTLQQMDTSAKDGIPGKVYYSVLKLGNIKLQNEERSIKHNQEKTFIHKALIAINKGDATSLRKNIKEAILAKVCRAVAKREKEIAKTFLDETTNITDNDSKEYGQVATKIDTQLNLLLAAAPWRGGKLKDRLNAINKIRELADNSKAFTKMKHSDFEKTFATLSSIIKADSWPEIDSPFRLASRKSLEKAAQEVTHTLYK